MDLTGDRLEVIEGERVRMVLLVGTPQAVVLASGGVDHLKHEIEDIGFRDVTASAEAPDDWNRGRNAHKPIGLDWLLWVEATPVRPASLSRTLTEDLSVLDAWAASDDAPSVARVAHPYSVVCFASSRLFGVVRVFGLAYPVFGMEGSC